MKTFLIVVGLFATAMVSLQAQSVNIAFGAGFSSMSPPKSYEFMYENGMMWPGVFEESTGQTSDIGFNISSILEFRFPIAPISLTAGISYSQLYGKTASVKAQSPPWYGTMYTIGELKTRANILTFRTGAQWEIIHSFISPYVSLELLYNIFGDTRLSVSNSSGTTNAVINGNTRVGLAFGGGFRMAVLASIDAIVGVNYSLNNLVTPNNQEYHKNMLTVGTSLLLNLL